jgi:predicted metalloprotease with PDZ domain
MGKSGLLTLALVLALCGEAKAQPAGPGYVLTLSSLGAAHVDMEMPLAPTSLYMMTAASGDPENGFAPFVQNLALACGGKPLSLTRQGAAWKIAGTASGRCQAHYDVDLSFANRHWPPGNEQAAFTDGKGAFAVSKALFIESDLPGERRLEIRKAKSFQLETPWTADADGIFHFQRDDILRDLIAWGDLAAGETSNGLFHATIVTFGILRDEQPQIKSVVDKVSAQYNAIFPGGEPASFLVVLIPGSQDDGEAYTHGFASTMRAPLRPDEKIVWANTIAHEIFHHWCGQTIRMDGTDLEWFKEGVPEYNANLALIRTGLISPEEFLHKAANMVGQYEYFQASGLFKDVTMLTAGAQKGPDRFGVYAAGWVMAFTMDQDIRAASGGGKTLDDLMRLLLVQTRSQPLTVPMLLEAVESLAGHEARTRIEQAISSRVSIQPEQQLEAMGLHVDGQSYQDEYFIHADPDATPAALTLRRRWANF